MEDNRETYISFSVLIMQLYGQKHYQRVKSYQSVESARKYYIRIITSIRHAISETIEISDRHQIIKLNNILKYGEKQLKMCKKFSEIDPTFISIQTQLIFQLIGNMPNSERVAEVINRKEKWKLNAMRQIQYVQNSSQKEIAIFHLIQTKFQNRFGDWGGFVEIYYKECNNNLERLLEFLRKNHPDIYSEI